MELGGRTGLVRLKATGGDRQDLQHLIGTQASASGSDPVAARTGSGGSQAWNPVHHVGHRPAIHVEHAVSVERVNPLLHQLVHSLVPVLEGHVLRLWRVHGESGWHSDRVQKARQRQATNRSRPGEVMRLLCLQDACNEEPRAVVRNAVVRGADNADVDVVGIDALQGPGS